MPENKQINRAYPICYYVGLIILVLGYLMIIPAVTAICSNEPNIFSIFLA